MGRSLLQPRGRDKREGPKGRDREKTKRILLVKVRQIVEV